MKTKNFSVVTVFVFIFLFNASAQKSSMAFTVKMENPEWHVFQVSLVCKNIKKEFLDFKMPVWTPGYYQRLDFGKNVEQLKAKDDKGNQLKCEKTSDNSWRVYSNNANTVSLSYDVKTVRQFVATPWLDENRAYILPAGVFMHIDKMINHPVQVTVLPDSKWSRVATGLDSIAAKKYTYTAPDFDILYDCPILAGDLEELPSFIVRGIKHRFIGYKLGDFNKEQFVLDLKKIIDAAVNVIGSIPYKSYTFLAIGPGQGGIEHLNNTTFGFNGTNLDKRENYVRILHFLTHEYFHHYNVKRIRPVELGPFDYDNGSRTKMLWVSEGLSVYYEYLIVRRAGITTDEELLNAFTGNIKAFEDKPGKLYQTLEQASYETWSDGPFGRTGDEVNKTISYYDKGPAVGLLFDLKIRQATNNQKSLDDVMRFLYKEYYQKKKRGFTEEELRNAFESVAGTSLADEYEYVTTTKELDYEKYLSYAGLHIDTVTHIMPGGYLGFSVRDRNDSVLITNVDYQSAGWITGLRRGQPILQVNGSKATADAFNKIIASAKPGDKIIISVPDGSKTRNLEFIFRTKAERSYKITTVANPDPSQKQILESWLKG